MINSGSASLVPRELGVGAKFHVPSRHLSHSFTLSLLIDNDLPSPQAAGSVHPPDQPDASYTPPNLPLQTYLSPLLQSTPALSTTTLLSGSHARLHSPAGYFRAPFARHRLAREPLRPTVWLAVRRPARREVQERRMGEFVGLWVLGQLAVWDRHICL